MSASAAQEKQVLQPQRPNLHPINGYVLIRLDEPLPAPCQGAHGEADRARRLRDGVVIAVADDIDVRFPGLELILYRHTRVAVNAERAIRACQDDGTLVMVYGFDVCAVLNDDEPTSTDRAVIGPLRQT